MNRALILTATLMLASCSKSAPENCLMYSKVDVNFSERSFLFYADKVDDAFLIDPICPRYRFAIDANEDVDFQPLQKAIYDAIDTLEGRTLPQKGIVVALVRINGSYISDQHKRRVFIKEISLVGVDVLKSPPPNQQN